MTSRAVLQVLFLVATLPLLGVEDPELRAYLEQRMFVVTAPATREQLPSRVVNTTHLPVVTSQLNLGTCGAYSPTYYYRTFLRARKMGWVRPDPETHPERCASTAYTYKLLRRDPLGGASILGTVQNMVDFGVCTLADMPYTSGLDTYTWPEEQKWRDAMAWRPLAAGQIPSIHTLAGQAVLKSHLYGAGEGDMAVIALRNAPNVVEYPDGMHTNNGVLYALQEAKSSIQHAFAVLGYDDNREYLDERDGLIRKGAFLVVNSWGQGWGVELPEAGTGGFAWISYDLLLKELQDERNGTRSAVVMLERGEYTPQVMARIGLAGDTRMLSGGLSPSGEGGSEWVRLFPGIGDEARATDQGIWIDVTGMLASGSAGVRFHGYNFAGGPAFIDDLKLVSGDDATQLAWTETAPVQFSGDVMAMTRLYVGRYQNRVPTPEMATLADDATWFDWTGNGFPDAAVTSAEGTWLWTNTGNGRAGFTTTEQPAFSGGHTVRWLDANGDGHIDLLVASATETKIYAGDGAGSFALLDTLPGCRRQGVAVADFDRDGRPDLVLGKDTETAVYLNTGAGFEKIRQTLPALFAAGVLAVADVDGDGLPDLLLAGAGEADWNTHRTRLFRNAGLPLHFEEMETNLPAVTSPAVTFGDANGDGHPDLAISGCTAEKWMRLYINDGTGNFQERNTTLPPLRQGTLQWCDLNANGRPDLVATGATADDYAEPGARTIAVINRPDGTFADFGLPLPHAYRGFLVARDVTGDANPDLFVGGSKTGFAVPPSADLVCALYDYSISTPGLFPVNTPPTAPGNLACAPAGGGVFAFTWDSGTDAETPTAALRYEWRCGRTAEAGDIVHGELARSGVQLRQPPVGTLYWQVRTVDSAGVASAWSPVQEYVVAPYQLAHHLRLESSPAWGGTVESSAASPIGDGTAVTLTATPAPGFEFVGWEGDIQGLARGAAATFAIGEDRWIQAVFAAKASPVLPIWTLVRETIMEPHNDWFYHTRDHTLESFADRLVRIGGRRSDNQIQDVVLTSDNNGASWQWNVNAALPFEHRRYDHVSAVYDGKLWIAGGTGTSGYLTDVWYTTNLNGWTRATASAPWEGRRGASLVVANGKLWYLGGGTSSERYCDVWYSTDGANWTAVPTPAGWVQSQHFQAGPNLPWPVAGTSVRVTVLDDVLYGTDGQNVWSSPDGIAWTLLAKEPDPFMPLPDGVVPAPFGPLHKFGFTTFDGELVLLGGENWRLGQTMNEVWSSPDGQAWTRTAPASRAHWSPRRNPPTAVHNGKLFLVGGESPASAVLGDVWHCVPGEMPVGMGALVIEATPLTPWVGGTTEPRPGFYVDTLGSVFDIRAVPAYGYVLDHWVGPVVDNGDGDPHTVQVTLAGEETRVKAVFVFSETRLTVRTSPHGAGVTVPEAQTAYAYPPNQWVAISAKAKPGYVFTHWTGPAEEPNSPDTRVFMDAWHEVVAVFRKMPVPGSMSCSMEWAAVIRDGVVWGLGGNTRFQMGHELPTPNPGEFWPVALFEGAAQVYAERDGARAVCMDGTMVAWGSGYMHYLLGVRPHPSYLSLSNVVQCTGGSNLVGIFRKGDGTLVDYLNKPIDAGFGAGPMGDVIDVTSNGSAHFAVFSDGLLHAWGSNRAGQLGIAGLESSNSPREVPGIDRVYATVLGQDSFRPFTLALRNDGTVWSWGDPRGGQLGRIASESEPAEFPAPVPGLADVVKLAAGSSHALALTHGGELYAWGTNQFGQLGTGTYDNEAEPVPVATPDLVVDVAAGPFYTLLHLADDSYCWMGATPGAPDAPLVVPTAIPGLGAGYPEGRLTVGTNPPDADGSIYPPPGEHPFVLDRPVHFRARDGERHVFAHWSTNDIEQDVFLSLAEDSTVAARFRFAHGTLAKLTVETSGQGTTDPAPGLHEYRPGTVVTLTALPAAGHAFSHWEGDVAEPENNRTTVLLDRDRTVRACFVPIPQQVPPRVATGLAGYYDAMILHTNTTVHGLRAPGGTSFVRLNANSDPLADCLNLAVGNSGLCLALALDGTVWSWGGEAIVSGQNWLDGPTTFPGKVVESIGALRNVLRIGAGDDFGLALLADGTLRTWGYNGSGQLGHSLGENAVPLARTVVAADGKPLTDIRAAACDGQFVVAVRADGTVVAWGSNSHGQLGNQDMAASGVPLAVPGLSGIVEVAAGRDFAAALDHAGRVWTWGRNDVGQCARSTRSAIAAPGLVDGLPAIAELSLGRMHTLALDRAGGVWAWGGGADGRLGDGEAVDRPAPVRVANPDGTDFLADIVTVACATYSYAIARTGTVYSWGHSDYGVPVLRPKNNGIAGSLDAAAGGLHALSLASFPPEGGILSPGAGTLFLSHGTFVTVSAVPAPGYRFQYWKGGVATTTERVLGLRLVGDTRLTAHFAPAEPRLRLGQGQGYAGRSVFLGVYLEGDTAPLEGVSASFALPEGLRFASGSRGTRLPDSCFARGSFPDERTATVLVSGTEDAPILTASADLPVYQLEVAISEDLPPGDYAVNLLPVPAAAIAAGRAWVEPVGEAGRVTVMPEAGADLLFVMRKETGPENERDEPPDDVLAHVRQGREYVAELWFRDQRREGSPVADLRLDVGFSAAATCLGFEPVGLIGNPAGTVGAGSVVGFGGEPVGDRVFGVWYRLAALRFAATQVGANALTVDPDQVTVTLADASALPIEVVEIWLDQASVEQQANEPPVAQGSLPLAAAWGTQMFGQLAGYDPNADDALVFSIVAGPEFGSVDLDPVTGAFLYTPLPYHTGADSFSFTVGDGDTVSDPVIQNLYVTTGWCAVLNRGGDWAMLGREPSASDLPDDPRDLLAAADAPLAFVPPLGRRSARLQRDIRGAVGGVVWRLEAPARAGDSLLSWNPNQVPPGLRILRIEPVECPLGGERSTEMFWGQSLPLAAGIDYVFDVAMPTDLALDLDEGWNLVCLPGAPVFADPTLGQPAAPGIHSVWSWEQQEYLAVDQVEPYTGYWFYTVQDGLQFFTILPAFARDLPLDAGWNVIGVPRSVRVETLLGPGATVWRFRRLRYEPAEWLDPGEGYWLFRQAPGVLDLTEDDE